MSTLVFLITVCIVFGTILSVFGMKYLAQARQSANGVAREEAYRALAEKSATALAGAQAELGEVKTRLAAVETLLKTVE